MIGDYVPKVLFHVRMCSIWDMAHAYVSSRPLSYINFLDGQCLFTIRGRVWNPIVR